MNKNKMMYINTSSKQDVFDSVEEYLKSIDFPIRSIDNTRPWGGFFTFYEEAAPRFISQFYDKSQVKPEDFPEGAALSPKLLIVALISALVGNTISEELKFGNAFLEM